MFEKFKDVECLRTWHFQSRKTECIRGFDDKFPAGWIVVGVLAIGDGNPLTVTAATHGQDQDFIFEHAEPEWTLAPPEADIDSGVGAQLKARLGGAGFAFK